jgi:hypothetical protein
LSLPAFLISRSAWTPPGKQWEAKEKAIALGFYHKNCKNVRIRFK